ncbi:putative ribonuclease H-like domain-containing protein, partial [Tanacetum coccineum]
IEAIRGGYVCQPLRFEDPEFPDKGYKVKKALYGLHQAPRAWYETLSTYLLENRFKRGTIDKTLFIKDKSDILLVQVYVDDIIFGSTKKCLQVKQKEDGIFISQDKYMDDILNKFDFSTVKKASTPMETNKALLKDVEADDVDVHLYRSMIRSLMYLATSRPDIMFAIYSCARFQVTPKDSPLDMEAYSDRDYAGASLDMKSTTGGYQFLRRGLVSWQCKKQTVVVSSTTEAEYVATVNCYGQVLWIQNQLLDYGYNFMNTKIFSDNESTIYRKSTTGGCQFLGCRLISWQCKKQIVVDNSTTEAEYIAASNYCSQVLWIQNQMLDYGYNFMHTKIYIDNESTICIAKNPIFHSKTKHIEIRHHFIRDSYEKRLIQMIKIHTDNNFSDLLTKAFDVSRFQYLIASIDFLNANPIQYALIVNPTIFVSYVEQLWSTRVVKKVNGDVQIHALIDGKRIVVSEATIRRGLQFADEGGVDCLPTATIFEEIARMCSTVALAIICLATNHKFNFSKFILEGVASIRETYIVPTTLRNFLGNIEEPDMVDEDVIIERVTKQSNDPLSGEDRLKLQELMEVCTNLQRRVLIVEETKTTQAAEIISLKNKVKKLQKGKKSRTHKLKRLYKVSPSARVVSFEDEVVLGDQEDASKQGRKIADIDKDADITLVDRA